MRNDLITQRPFVQKPFDSLQAANYSKMQAEDSFQDIDARVARSRQVPLADVDPRISSQAVARVDHARAQIQARVSLNVIFDSIKIALECMEMLQNLRKSNRDARFEFSLLQIKNMLEASKQMRMEAFTTLICKGVLGGGLGVAAGIVTGLGAGLAPNLDAAAMPPVTQADIDKFVKKFESASKVLQSLSGVSDTGGQVVGLHQGATRYLLQGTADLNGKEYDNMTRMLEDLLQSFRNYDNFIEKIFQSETEVNRRQGQ